MNPLVAPESSRTHSARCALSVNVNKVALLRNTRHLGIPSVLRAAEACLLAGAQGITVHPRPDARHIRTQDVHELAALMKAWPQAEFNIEGNPTQNLMDFVRELRPHQVTFVPDSEDQFTSDHGWQFPADMDRLRPLVAEASACGVRVSLFMDPLPEAMAYVAELGAERVELYTETYASAFGSERQAEVLAGFTRTAEAALALGLGLNAGHDLNRDNLTAFLRAVPGVQEVSIGHALVADALELGYTETVRDYQRCIQRAYAAL
ncbi:MULTISPECIES: pyridoxine 5'-phosphate synthase [Roseateles]|uniref:Pyridoxine 5'-phosphate synthase n=1 Tax=Roseateles albus TaxID=2987525 RepID=A0ABT5KFS5_9BURK|nr:MULTISPECIES: pyridoxine 5'-phosphate synthase [Roseateles]MCV2357380.1 pyridoxine 5'-phosphate synthase [Paucibacter sp. TC2R-5]MDC8772767.1 pyridoxine 5'-phosphate synthase [Roseateles albus]